MPWDSTGANDAFMNAILRRIGGGQNRADNTQDLTYTELPPSFPDLTTDAVQPGTYETAAPVEIPTGDEYISAQQQWKDLADSYSPEQFSPAIYEGGLDKVSKTLGGGTASPVIGKNKSTFKPWRP